MRRCHSSCCRRGVALIWVAVFGMVLIGFVGVALDVSLAVLTGNQLQDAADAASLAGALRVRIDTSEARDWAVATALANKAAGQAVQLDRNDPNAEAGDIVIGHYDRDNVTFDPTGSPTNAVKIVARRTSGSLGGPLPLNFGPVFGVNNTEVSRDAIAMVGGGTGAGLITLNPDEQCSLLIEGNVTVNVSDISDPANPQPGSVQVNSSNEQAACANGNPTLEAGEVNVNGGTDAKFSGLTGIENLNDQCNCTISDPLAGISSPTDFGTDQGTVNVTSSMNLSLSPGYYPGGISMTSKKGSITCAPGLYVVDGAGLDIKGGDFTAYGVMFYIIDSTPTDNKPSRLYLGGNGAIDITGIDPGQYTYPVGVEIYESITFFQARDYENGGIYGNSNESTIIGTSLMNLEGTLYFPTNQLEIGGTPASLGNQLIADTLLLHGNGTLLINYDGRNPAPGNDVFLVW